MSSLRQRLQSGVAFEALCERRSAFWSELVPVEPVGTKSVCFLRDRQRALTQKRTLWDGGALQLLEHTVLLDAARDDDGGGSAQPLEREVDLLGRLCALELVDLKRVPVHTAKGRGVR